MSLYMSRPQVSHYGTAKLDLAYRSHFQLGTAGIPRAGEEHFVLTDSSPHGAWIRTSLDEKAHAHIKLSLSYLIRTITNFVLYQY